MKTTFSLLLIFLIINVGSAQEGYLTYCNPVNLDYTYRIDLDYDDISYRSGADPAVVKFQDEYYLFASRSMGYWHSKDLTEWNFIKPEKWYLEGSSAPTAENFKDSVLYVMGNPYGSMSVIYTDDPKTGDWKGVPSILNRLKDPELFIDDDRQAYIFSSAYNQTSIQGKKLDMERSFRPEEEVVLFELNPEKNGWERYLDDPDTDLQAHIRGPGITKHNDKYYLQYGVPGMKAELYADGAYISEDPLGPYEYMPGNPFSFKPGGFINGAGNGSTIQEEDGSFWRFATMVVDANSIKEQRIGMFPTFFDEDGLMQSDTYFGDYPHFAPTAVDKKKEFTGWMLLSYKRPVKVSSETGEHNAENIVDENIRSFWLAEENNREQWVEIDLEKPVDVHAIQINYHDHQSDMYGKVAGLYHQYIIEASADGNSWKTIVDKSENSRDTPHAYVELPNPERARYIRYKNIAVPTPHLSISGLRVFGKGEGKAPQKVKNLETERQEDRRNLVLTWKKVKDAQGYNLLWGTAPDKLYNSWMVYEENELEMTNLSTDQTYYFAIESFNENGVSKRTKPVKLD